MSEQGLIVVRSYSSEMDAQLAKSRLDAAGIFSAIFKDDVGGTRPYLQLTEGVRLMVRKSEFDQASAVLG